MKINYKVLEFIKENNLIIKGDTVICGLSGGADSCAMVHILHSLKKELGFNLVCAHLNHMLREGEALRDMEFAKAFSESLSIPFYCKSEDVAKYAYENKLSPEDAGRKLRYDFFKSICLNFPDSKIATAHNKEDNAETIFMHILRGCGINGICGIKPKRDNIIRPVLCLLREETEWYCKENNIHYVTDSSNLQDLYTRNKIRLNIFPELKKINPSFVDAFLRLSKTGEEINSYIKSYTDKISIKTQKEGAFVFASDIKDSHSCFYPQLLANMLKAAGFDCEITQKSVDAFIRCVNSENSVYSADIGNGISIKRMYDSVGVVSLKKPEPFSYVLKNGDKVRIYNKEIFISDAPENGAVNIPIQKNQNIIVRSRLAGDKIYINGMHKKLQDIFVNKKIPRHLRDTLLIIDVDGNILWAECAGFSDYTEKNSPYKYIVITKTEDN